MVIRNRYSVPKKTWNKWTRIARATFNGTFKVMLDQAYINHAPGAKQLPREDWRTVAWNAAWEAACATQAYELEALAVAA